MRLQIEVGADDVAEAAGQRGAGIRLLALADEAFAVGAVPAASLVSGGQVLRLEVITALDEGAVRLRERASPDACHIETDR